MQVPYRIAPTPARGGPGSKGLFATAPIPKGTLIWDISKAKVQLIPLDEAEIMCAAIDARGEFHNMHDIFQYSYFNHSGHMVDITSDDGRYFNHCSEPNTCEGRQYARIHKERSVSANSSTTGTDTEFSTDMSTDDEHKHDRDSDEESDKYDTNSSYALRDIAEGEELLSDYGCFGTEPEWYLRLLNKHNVPTDYY